MKLPPETCITVARSLSDRQAEKISVAELAEAPARVPARYVEIGAGHPLPSKVFDERGGRLIAFDLRQDADLRDVGEAVAELGAGIAGRERIWPGSAVEVRLLAAIDGHFMYTLTPAGTGM